MMKADYDFVIQAVLDGLDEMEIDEMTELKENLIAIDGHVFVKKLIHELHNKIEDEVVKKGLCPECYDEVETRVVTCYSNGYYEPPGSWTEIHVGCACGWSE